MTKFEQQIPSKWVWLVIIIILIYGIGNYMYGTIYPLGENHPIAKKYRKRGQRILYIVLLIGIVMHYKEHYKK